MRNLLITIICFVTINGFSLPAAFADQDPEISPEISIGDAENVDDAVAHITAALERQGFEIVLTVNHSAAAAGVGRGLAPTQVIFARPPRLFERRLLKRSDTIGIDLPLKFLVFHREGETEIQVTFNSVGYLVDRHDIKINDLLLWLLQYKVEQFGDAPDGLITIQSLLSVEETVQSLQEAILSNPAFRIPLVLDYDADRGHDRYHRDHRLPVLIVFGNPNAGTPLMQADQCIGIDLPQKILVWEDADDGVYITYNDPFFIARRHNIQGQDKLLEAIAGALRRFVLLGAGRSPNEEN